MKFGKPRTALSWLIRLSASNARWSVNRVISQGVVPSQSRTFAIGA